MKILYDGRTLEVYAIYWSESRGVRQRHHLVFRYDDYQGLSVITESECEVLDYQVSDFILKKDETGEDGFVHAAVLKDDLLDRLIEGEPGAKEELFQHLGKS